ncbi:mitochondrial escape protein 2 [Orbilia oligospora]|uniref:Mitochondrial escape protein 2 n=1 Tax=Orbilia oligospora TaxID=2813651 RepID=A0A7C8V0Q3_ORBOL|nr:mitochondrial escape protein 2 [Orbilia oligospora]KAF3229161.1 mitochondrial escape protein 2 [Orbilia oligospora]
MFSLSTTRAQCLRRAYPRSIRQSWRFQPPRRHATATAIPTGATGNTDHVEPTESLSNVLESGFIDLKPNEGLLFFDNIYPVFSAFLDTRFIPVRLDQISSADKLIKYSIPKEFPIKVNQVIPRVKEGGAFVKFIKPANTTDREVEQQMQNLLQQNKIRPWYSPFGQIRCFLVEGRPWLEDLQRFPAARLKVEFEGQDVSPEQLYTMFRRFGRLIDINPLPRDSKELPRYAYLTFGKIRSATAARNCLHDLRVKTADGKETQLRILYSRTVKAHTIRKWIIDHPKIVVPIILAVIAAIAIAVFDPIRTFFVEAHITHSLDFGSKAWTWFKGAASTYLILNKKSGTEGTGDLSVLWEERKETVETVKSWLLETTETFIVVQGPRGSGKRDLVLGDVLKDWNYTLVFDCEPVQDGHGDAQIIRAAAAQVGYRPVFGWLNSINSWVDLAVQGTLGTSAGLSETLETQFTKILQNTATALKNVALSQRQKIDKDISLNDDEWLEAHPEKRPVVVIDNFLHRTDAAGEKIYQRLSDWAALLVSANVAHVIFMTNDVSFSKQLARSLPDRVFRTVMLGDASPEAAKRYVLSHIHSGMSDEEKSKEIEELDSSIDQLGGRLTDLEFLARRIRTGEMPAQAVSEIVKTSANEILKLYFLGDPAKRSYTKEQAWTLIKMFGDGKEDQLRYNEVLLHGLFSKGGEEAIQALEQAEFITIVSAEGRPWAIKPGKPVYRAAFRKLQSDKVLQAKLDIDVATELTKTETANVAKYETELTTLAQLPSKPSEIAGRVSYLLKKLQASQMKIEQYEKEIGALKKILQSEF